MFLKLYKDLLIESKYKPFYLKEEIVDWYKLHIFSYSINDDWMYDNWNIEARKEMRGLAYLIDEKWNPKLLSLPFKKFFNNQEREDEVNWINEKEIEIILDKEDGSLISCWLFPNWKLLLKSKSTFLSEEAKLANSVITEEQKNFCIEMINQWLYPIFELVGRDNVIVLEKNKSRDNQLVLLAIRDSSTWNLLPFSKIKELINWRNIPLVKEINLPIKEIIERTSLTNKEDEWVVVCFTDWNRLKIKFKEYLENHYFMFLNFSYKKVLKTMLNEWVDDIQAFLKSNDRLKNKYQEFLTIYNDIKKQIGFIDKEIKEILKRDKDIEGRDFYEKNKENILLPLLLIKKNKWNNNELAEEEKEKKYYKNLLKFLIKNINIYFSNSTYDETEDI